MAKADPPVAAPERRAASIEAALKVLPIFPSVPDLLEIFPSKDLLLDAYARGWLPKDAEEALEANASRLHCWLEARILRVLLEARG